METPNKMIGGIAGAMAQQTGVLGGAADLRVQPQPGAMSVGPHQPPSAFNPNSMLTGQGIYGSMDQRQQSVGAPFQFTDQTGDGEVTQADVIKARTEGYKK